MRVLLVGGGGREHALAWALSRSPLLRRLRCAPGNPGIAELAECIPLRAEDVDRLSAHAISERYDLVVVGPEAPLVAGLADRLRAEGIAVFGPSAAAARLEGSKSFAKEFMARHAVPTAACWLFDDAAAARSFLLSSEAPYPLVLKVDGLAAGKGVVLVDDAAAAVSALTELSALGAASSRWIVEERLFGREVSYFVLTDGRHHVELAPCQDYKRLEDGDRGPNTGGMGSYSPSVFADGATIDSVRRHIVEPVVHGLAAEGHPYQGVLYIGLMLTSTGPRVLEFNARFGDPEAQALLPRLDGDWLELLTASARGTLEGTVPRWRDEATVCVVLASAGYPQQPHAGAVISGLERLAALDDVWAFHAATAHTAGGAVTTAGGRVLGITARADTLAAARQRVYRAVGSVDWPDMQYRKDIAADALGSTE